jgi:hypothetical protein
MITPDLLDYIKTIQIILNPGNKIKESNYDNNIFTQKIEFYSN